MGECYWWMWLEVDGGLVVHSMVVSKSTFTMNKHANAEWVWIVQVSRKILSRRNTKRNSIFVDSSYVELNSIYWVPSYVGEHSA